MKILLLGASGLTGSLVLEGLLSADRVTAVITPLRRNLDRDHPKLHQEVVDFAGLGEHDALFDVDVIICCLGTTIGKAGSRKRFREVDYGYAMQAAEAGKRNGAPAFILMSAVGASASSLVFYNRVKGELEADLRSLAFPYLSVYHPGLLLAERDEQRRAEELGMKAMPLINRALVGPVRKYRGIPAATVAKAIVNEVIDLPEKNPVGQYTHTYDDIVSLAEA